MHHIICKEKEEKKRLPSSYTLLNTVDNFKGGILVYLKKGHEKLFPSIDFFSLHSWFPVFTYPSFLLVFHWKGSTAWVHLFHLWPRKKKAGIKGTQQKNIPNLCAWEAGKNGMCFVHWSFQVELFTILYNFRAHIWSFYESLPSLFHDYFTSHYYIPFVIIFHFAVNLEKVAF